MNLKEAKEVQKDINQWRKIVDSLHGRETYFGICLPQKGMA